MARQVRRRNVVISSVLAAAIAAAIPLTFTEHAHAGKCEAFWCPIQQVGNALISAKWLFNEASTILAFAENFTKYFQRLQDDTNRLIQSDALTTDSVRQAYIDIENRDRLNKYMAPTDRCRTEDINTAIPQVERNVGVLAATFNRELVQRAEKGAERPVALIKADVAASEGETAVFEGNDTITAVLYPRGLTYQSKQQQQAAKSYVDRLVLSVWPPQVPAAQQNTNKGILYKKQRLDFIAKLNLVQASFAQLLAENTSQDGLISLLKNGIEADGEYVKRLLKDREGAELQQASASTLMRFEIERRLTPDWQKKQEDKHTDALWREVANLRNITLWLDNRQRLQDQRIEMLFATLLVYETDAEEKTKLEDLYSNL